jgi:hypothetical protein
MWSPLAVATTCRGKWDGGVRATRERRDVNLAERERNRNMALTGLWIKSGSGARGACNVCSDVSLASRAAFDAIYALDLSEPLGREPATVSGHLRPHIGEIVTEQADIEPAKAKVLQHVRFKYGPCDQR